MRFISTLQNGYTIYAVTGTNTVSFAIDYETADVNGLLGFAVERHDKTENERYFIYGYKVFKDVIPNPDENTVVSTWDQPVQSFSWDDMTAKPTHSYDYFFYPLKGQPKNIDRTAPPVKVSVTTEDLNSTTNEHDVFFNRGVASSQAYRRRFKNKSPDNQETPEKRQEAYDWLTRDLGPSLIKFIDQAQHGDALHACVYEFHYPPVLEALKKAADRGVDVQIVADAKQKRDKNGNLKPSFPRDINMSSITDAGLDNNIKKFRVARTSDIQHNKFIVYTTGGQPTSVWSGSTNISTGGIFGQTNVGHWVRNAQLAQQYKNYWDIISEDPGGLFEDTAAIKRKKNKDYEEAVTVIQPDLPNNIASVPAGVTPIFSPRPKDTMLDFYAFLLDAATRSAYITLAFGVSDVFKKYLQDNTANNQLIFMLLEKKDVPDADHPDTFIKINASNNVYKANGAYIKDTLYQWTKEVNTLILGLNLHVIYIHSKFMLIDPLSADPIIVTGSANFSDASTTKNDENMMIIRGNQRVADIYLTEFMRLFNHYYFRTVLENLRLADNAPSDDSLFLSPNDTWQQKYSPGTFKKKRLDLFKTMAGALQG